uniref:Ig-like domain-containing protein n=1 Tax=Astyanax mexicanus TaxID=7994 RepID=A0A3B1JK55_ASTMX
QKPSILTELEIFISAGCDLVNSGKIEEVTGFSGESVLLPCSCTNLHSKPSTVTWKFTSRESKTSADEEIYPNQNKQCSVQHDHKYIRLYIKVCVCVCVCGVCVCVWLWLIVTYPYSERNSKTPSIRRASSYR